MWGEVSFREIVLTWFYCWSQREKEEEIPTGSFVLQGGLQSAPICMLIRSQILRQQFIEYAFKSLPGKTRRWAFLPPSSALSPGGIAAVSTQVGLLRTVSSFVTVLCDS